MREATWTEMLDAETSGGKSSSLIPQILISACLLSSALFLVFALHSTVPKAEVTGRSAHGLPKAEVTGRSAHGPGCVPHTSEQNVSLL